MTKIKVYNGEGRTRDERESCFPSMETNASKSTKNRGQVRDDR